MKYTNALTFIVRDDGPLIHCGDSPAYRTFAIELTEDQMAQVHRLEKTGEEISRIVMNPSSKEPTRE